MDRDRKSRRQKQIIRRTGLVLFLVYAAALAYFLFFADWYDHAPGRHWAYRYNLIPFREIRRFLGAGQKLAPHAVFLNLAGNIIGFIPFGFFLPVVSGRLGSARVVIGAGFLSSLAVEVIQLVSRTGCFDVDDIILNTLGTVCGYLLFRAANAFRRRTLGGE